MPKIYQNGLEIYPIFHPKALKYAVKFKIFGIQINHLATLHDM
jgi:hypothetical protein